MFKGLEKIVSGGQTGVDRAALDFALENRIRTGGWIPKGRRAEDGKIPANYKCLKETDSDEYAKRTELNVRDSDATLIISAGKLTGGSLLTEILAKRHSKPCIHIDLDAPDPEDAVADVIRWLASIDCGILNIAGPRASSDPSVYVRAKALLRSLL